MTILAMTIPPTRDPAQKIVELVFILFLILIALLYSRQQVEKPSGEAKA